MSIIVALVILVLIVTACRGCLVTFHFILVHGELFLVILLLVLGLCIPCVLVQSGVVLLLIVAHFLIPPVIVLVSVASCVLRYVTIERSVEFGLQYERVDVDTKYVDASWKSWCSKVD
jgi:hypothetical protein